MRLSGELSADTMCDGEVILDGDVVVPAGVTLSVRPGAVFRFASRPRWSCAVFRSAPEGYPIEATARRLCDLVVLGRLRIDGAAGQIRLDDGGEWGGVTALGRAQLDITGALLGGFAEAAVQAFDDSRVRLRDSGIGAGPVGALCWGTSLLDVDRCRFEDAGTGVLAREGALATIRRSRLSRCGIGAHGQHWSLIAIEDSSLLECREAGAAAYDRSALDAIGTEFAGCGDAVLAASEARASARDCRFRGNRSDVRAAERGSVAESGCLRETAACAGAVA